MKPGFSISSLVVVVMVFYTSTGFAVDYVTAQKKMIEEINQDIGFTSFLTKRKQFKQQVMAAMATVPRHKFVPESMRARAYENRPLPIGYGQTISQPYIVALMSDILDVGASAKVLEIGTGSGYQAAILAELVQSVFTIEIVEPLASSANKRLHKLGYKNIKLKTGDGYYGWEEHGPFDGIIVTAAASHIPPPLVKQLKPGGRMVIPVGSRFFTQNLTLIKKSLDGSTKIHQLLPVAFVPLTGGH